MSKCSHEMSLDKTEIGRLRYKNLLRIHLSDENDKWMLGKETANYSI